MRLTAIASRKGIHDETTRRFRSGARHHPRHCLGPGSATGAYAGTHHRSARSGTAAHPGTRRAAVAAPHRHAAAGSHADSAASPHDRHQAQHPLHPGRRPRPRRPQQRRAEERRRDDRRPRALATEFLPRPIALLPVAGLHPDRAVRSQPPGVQQQTGSRRSRPRRRLREVQRARARELDGGDVAAGAGLPHGPVRQVPQRLPRDAWRDLHPAGLGPLVRQRRHRQRRRLVSLLQLSRDHQGPDRHADDGLRQHRGGLQHRPHRRALPGAG